MQQENLDSLKQVILSPILKLVDLEKPFELETNTSGRVVGAFLNEEGKCVSFESKKLFVAMARPGT